MAVRKSLSSLHAYTPGEQPSGEGVLKLNTNENPYPPSPKVREALSAVTDHMLRTYPEPVARELRKEIAELHGLAPEQVLVCNGSDEGLALCTRAFCEPGGRVGYLAPSYSLYPVLSGIADLETVEFPLRDDFGWDMPERMDVDLFFLTQPNAPTAQVLSRVEVENLIDRCSGAVLVDEAYVDFAEESMLSLLRENRPVLVSRSFSKSYSLAGIRMGYLLGPAEWISALYKIKDSYNTDAVAQRIALAALRDQETLIKNVETVKATRRWLTDALRSRGFAVQDSSANFVFAKVPHGENARELFEALRERRVFVRHFSGELTSDYLRITVGTDEQIERFLEELDRARDWLGDSNPSSS